MPLKIHNTLTREREEFVPLNPPEVLFYSCGPTVYGEFHIGNARTFVATDIIRRWLIESGYKVRYVQNITDVDDKIIARAAAEGTTSEAIAARYTDYFLNKLAELGNLPADDHPRATKYIGPMIAMIKQLEKKGHAYPTPDGSVWFHVESFPGYGKLSRRPLDQMQQGERVDATMQSLKRSPQDFALWKAAKPGEPAWKSPWGEGRPGWHIECSCMAIKALGRETIDLHAGGQDLLFPHHENEIAQSEATTGKQFSRYWVHIGMLDIDGEKMSKSLGNFKTIDDVLGVMDVLTLRYFLMSARYRDKIDFTEDNISKCRSAMDRILNASRLARRFLSGTAPFDWQQHEEASSLWAEFRDGMDDDFNTPRAIAALADGVRALNSAVAEQQQERAAALSSVVEKMRNTLGLGRDLEKADRDLSPAQVAAIRALAATTNLADQASATEASALVDSILTLRTEARRAKNFAESDRLRLALTECGIVIEDKPEGSSWRIG